MKKQLNLLLLLLLCTLCSCLKTDDNRKDTYMAFATVENPERIAQFYLILDDGTRLYTAETPKLTDPNQGYPADGKRVFVSYNELKPKTDIKLLTLAGVAIKGISPENTTGRNDRHQLVMLAGGANFLNVLVGHNYSSFSNIQHDVILRKKEYRADEAEFDLIYSNKGDSGYEYGTSPFSFDLSPLKEQYPGEITLVINTYEQTTPKAYTITYKWQ